ncbi:hypothetical protein [Actinocrispum sp. NPDC049592]|uniref:hypothetical protein n=1 Tax=Actinocrispum sp. NPDC049592 TaxID=3154835 RepID=UPI0034440E70
MTREEGPERTQRTVAELLAKYGGNPEESTPRRRRRRADDAEETAPQAIIDRVMSDSSGNLPRVGADGQPVDQQAQQPPQAPRAGHAAPTSRHRPVPQPSQQLPQPSGQLPTPSPQPSQQLPKPQSSQQLPQPSQQLPKPQPSQQLPQPSQQLPKPQPSQQLPQPSQQLPRPDPAQALQPTQRAMPPVAPPERRTRQDTGQRPVPQPSQQLPKPQQSQQLPRPNPQQTGGWPAAPAEAGGLAARLDGRADSRSDLRPAESQPSQQLPQPSQQLPRPVQDGMTEQMPRISDRLAEEAGPQAGVGNRTGQHPAPHRVARNTRPPQPSMAMPAPAFPQHEPEERDNYPTEYHGFGPVAEETQYVESLDDDYDDDLDQDRSLKNERPVGVDDFDDEDEPEKTPSSPLKEWLSMAGQLAIGVIGGAALWLGFNWLWGKLPTAALIVALVVTVGMVWVVRKIRHQEDLWTTIITMVVSLVITMSPVLLSR